MLRRIESLLREHVRLRQLLDTCERVAPERLRETLVQLQQELAPHFQAKQGLYERAAQAVKDAGDATGVSLLGIFRTNLEVTSSAVLHFLRSEDPQPERMRQRLGSVIGALRSLLDTEERVVFPLYTRHAPASEKGPEAGPAGGAS